MTRCHGRHLVAAGGQPPLHAIVHAGVAKWLERQVSRRGIRRQPARHGERNVDFTRRGGCRVHEDEHRAVERRVGLRVFDFVLKQHGDFGDRGDRPANFAVRPVRKTVDDRSDANRYLHSVDAQDRLDPRVTETILAGHHLRRRLVEHVAGRPAAEPPREGRRTTGPIRQRLVLHAIRRNHLRMHGCCGGLIRQRDALQ